jgi:hypothetical protein
MKEKRLLILGFLLVTAGMVLPYLMVVQLLPASFLLSFLSYAFTTGGMFLGLIGAATYMKQRK